MDNLDELEREDWGWDHDRFMEPWDESEYEPDPEREWEGVTWVGDELVPLDSVLKLR